MDIDTIIVDSHNDTMSRVIDEETWLPVVDIGDSTELHIDIPKMKAGKLEAGFFAAYNSEEKPERALSKTLALINALYWTEESNKDEFSIASTYDEIENSIMDRKIAAIPTIEGAYSITEENYLELIKQYKDLSVKVVGFNWNYSNALGEGANEEYANNQKSSGGLTDLGKRLVKEMDDLGMIVDVSHMNEETFWGVIETSRAPIIASHSGAYSIRPHQRNLKDNQLKAIAKNGGVAAIVLCKTFIKDSEDVSLKDYMDHIDYAVSLIGIDHVAIGSDFDGCDLPLDIKDASELYKIRDELVNRGYREEDINKLLGKNTLRVIKAVEELAETHMEAKDIEIIPDLKMGQAINGRTPLLTSKIEGNIDGNSLRVIVDGVVYRHDYNEDNESVALKINRPLSEKFHVVTFEVANRVGEIKRETRIIYIEDL
ncbi:membrane dipeptidase [Tissierella creatinini]|nr:membrane dipeptidase [Tissierella creatinini]TJX64640.1 membrane dipeptidase [Soehngenia saccharolytica]